MLFTTNCDVEKILQRDRTNMIERFQIIHATKENTPKCIHSQIVDLKWIDWDLNE
jgi:hypothetical protein